MSMKAMDKYFLPLFYFPHISVCSDNLAVMLILSPRLGMAACKEKPF